MEMFELSIHCNGSEGCGQVPKRARDAEGVIQHPTSSAKPFSDLWAYQALSRE